MSSKFDQKWPRIGKELRIFLIIIFNTIHDFWDFTAVQQGDIDGQMELLAASGGSMQLLGAHI